MLSIYATLQTLGFKIKNRLQKDETGATAVEYGIMVGIIAVAVIGAIVLLRPQLVDVFNQVTNQLGGAAAEG